MSKRKQILLTTSRRPTDRIRSFCRDFAICLPDVVRVNRGKLNLDGLVAKALESNADRVVIVDRWEGGFGKIQFFILDETGLAHGPPTIYIRGIKLRREFEIKRKRVRSSAITIVSEDPVLIKKVGELLAHFFNVPMLLVEHAVSKYSVSMHISTDTLGRIIITFVLLPEFVEVGPRVTVAEVTYF